MTVCRNYVNGEWVEGADVNRDVNPSNLDDVVGEYARGDAAQARAAIAAARAAFPGWATGNVQQRADILDRVGTEILARKDELGRLLSREEGKTLPEGVGEAGRAGYIFKFYAGEVLRQAGERLPSTRPGIDVEITREPLGVVALITPWNFPLAIPAWKIAPALAYGNTVVFKPADLVPGCAWALADLLHRAGLPAGVFNLVMGRGSAIGDTLIGSPDVDAISFTGSIETGKGIARKAVERLARVQLEMGGKNPLVVLDDADVDVGGQLRGPGRLLLDRPAVHGLQPARRHRGDPRPVRGGDGRADEEADRGRRAQGGDRHRPRGGPEPARAGPRVPRRRAQGRREAGLGRRAARAGAQGYYLQPALFTETTNAMRVNREEIFGPVATVIRAKGYDEALAIANDTSFGLSAGIVTRSLKHASHFKRHAEAGMVMVNLPTAGVDYHVPFGGRKGSNYGPREQGRYAREFYTAVKTAYIAP